MPETAPRELMVLVERVVRPLPIPLSRQKRLRKELLEHLQIIQAEELSRDNDAAAAWQRAQQRFGDPAELTAEFRATIGKWERLEARMERWQARHSSESEWRYALRLSGRFLLIITMLMALIMLDHHFFGTQRLSRIKIQVGGAALAFLSVWLGCFLVFGLQIGAEWSQRRRWSRIIPYSLCLIASWPASLLLMMKLAEGSWSDYTPPLIASVVGGLGSVVGGIFVGVVHRRETLYRRQWGELPLD